MKKLVWLQDKFSLITTVGMDTRYSDDLNSCIQLSNRMMLICIAATLPFAIGFPLLGELGLGIGIVCLCLGYGSCLYFHFKKAHFFASFLSYLLPVVGIVTYFLFTGVDAGFHYILFFCSAFGAVVFENRQKVVIGISMILPLIIFLILDFYADSLVIRYLFEGAIVSFLRVLGIVIAFMCTLATVSIYVYQQTQIHLRQQAESLKTKLKLEHVFAEIDEKNQLLQGYSAKQAYVSLTQGLAHEIRSTMTCLMAGAELLKDKSDNQSDVQRYSTMLITAIQRLTVLTKSMLTFGGSVAESRTTFSVNQLLDELVALATCYCSEKQIVLKTDFDQDCQLTANRVYLAQALINIIVNAIEHSNKRDCINVKSTVNHDVGEIAIMIQDTGNGISKEDQLHIFEQHYSSKQSSHNAGLGLALVQRVIVDHKGSIELDSDLGKGTTFIINLPF